jgi:hypothetical protein
VQLLLLRHPHRFLCCLSWCCYWLRSHCCPACLLLVLLLLPVLALSAWKVLLQALPCSCCHPDQPLLLLHLLMGPVH